MSDNDASAGVANSAWTDRERLVYMINLMDTSAAKLDYDTAARPNGRSLIACQRMIGRLKTAYKDDLEALKNGQPVAMDTAPKTPKKSPVKRKPKAVAEGESPKKRGRAKKATEEAAPGVTDGEDKEEVKEEHDGDEN